ncbi:MAG: heat-inducible transcriptional repressor HrcA [Armatimonadota bacterium]|nr:heat-inducible transcriptional repressor HrcA [Armatimonadota bacterium]
MYLDARRRAVLRAVVEEHIRSAEPVGSEHRALREQLGVSSATIRSAMAGLEEMGLLTHPHTSAGRVPTDRGYRVYVDLLLEAEPLSQAERQAIRRRLGGAAETPVDLLDQAAHVLAAIAQYASVVASPGLRQQRFQALHLLPLGEQRALAVIITGTGAVQGRPITLPAGIATEDLDELSRVITQRLQGSLLADLTDERLERVVGEASRYHQLLEALRAWLRRDLARGARPRLRVEGVRHLLREPEFRRPDVASAVLEALLDEESVLGQALAAAPGEGVWVSIGTENRFEELRACSLVVAGYRAGGRLAGVVGLVGPTRMRYRRAVAAVRYVADRLSEVLDATA